MHKEKKARSIFIITVIRLGISYLDTKRCKCGVFHNHNWLRTSKNQKKIYGINKLYTWGFYFSLKDAKHAVMNNALDMCESGYYDRAVIEKVQEPGLLSGGILGEKCEWWYKWRGSYKTGGFKPSRKPKCLSRIVRFWG